MATDRYGGTTTKSSRSSKGRRRMRNPVDRDTAATVLSAPQAAALCTLAVGLGFEDYLWGWRDGLVTLVAACEAFYLVFVSFKIILAIASYLAPASSPGPRLPDVDDPDLPVFTILLPNVKEKRHVLRALLESMAGLQYPKDKLQVLLLVEHWDIATQQMFGLAGGSGGVVPPGQLVSGATEEEEEELRLPAYASVVLSVPCAPPPKPPPSHFRPF